MALSQDIINLIITGFGGIIGWILKTLWEAMRSLQKDVREIETELHTQYITVNSYQRDIDEIKTILREIFADLKKKADK